MIISPFLGILKNWLILAAIIPGYCWYDHPEIRSNKGIRYNPPCDRGTCVAIFRSVNVFLAGIRPWPSLCGNGVHAGRLYIYNIYLYITHIYIYIYHTVEISTTLPWTTVHLWMIYLLNMVIFHSYVMLTVECAECAECAGSFGVPGACSH